MTRRPCPTLCAVCGLWARAPVCDVCVAMHAPTRWRCPRCAVPVPQQGLTCADCLRAPFPFARAVAAVDYTFPWRDLLAALKYRHALELADPLAQALANAVCAGHRPADMRPPPAIVLPVPLTATRLHTRGHNQAWELARRVAQRLSLPATPLGLQRHLDSAPQVGQSRADRIGALRGAFGVHPAWARRWHGRTVALVDDVMTTGATAAEATRVLLASGAASVQVWVVARTPPPG